MTKHIDIVFSSPPSMDAPLFIEIQNENGQALKTGEWLRPDAESPFWILRLSAAELVLQLIAPGTPMPEWNSAVYEAQQYEELSAPAGRPGPEPMPGMPGTPPGTPPPGTKIPISPFGRGFAQRQELRRKIAQARPKSAAEKAEEQRQMMNSYSQKCPDCNNAYNPNAHTLLMCKLCGDEKCTAICIPDPVGGVCLTCQALNATPDEGGFDPSAEPDDAPGLAAANREDGISGAPFSSRLFDGKFHPKESAVRAAGAEGIEDDDNEEE